ncbi:hypothetical protein BJ508DRAFT_311016 [Ascobolus immersus RN42]|uniref:Uncharacterized protein n=1 Tax=Ascobolus immersus RN42 TaxID=1160509 RepID=A0A3N4HS23_ASCIM|nr:hypothetical protein BJ508DRAFT_311016 [Ascobolus immersus RN42]
MSTTEVPPSTKPKPFEQIPHEMRIEISNHLTNWFDYQAFRQTDRTNMSLLTPRRHLQKLLRRFERKLNWEEVLKFIAASKRCDLLADFFDGLGVKALRIALMMDMPDETEVDLMMGAEFEERYWVTICRLMKLRGLIERDLRAIRKMQQFQQCPRNPLHYAVIYPVVRNIDWLSSREIGAALNSNLHIFSYSRIWHILRWYVTFPASMTGDGMADGLRNLLHETVLAVALIQGQMSASRADEQEAPDMSDSMRLADSDDVRLFNRVLGLGDFLQLVYAIGARSRKEGWDL